MNMFNLIDEAAASVSFKVESLDDIDGLIDKLQTYGQFRTAKQIGAWADDMIVRQDKEWEDASGYAPAI